VTRTFAWATLGIAIHLARAAWAVYVLSSPILLAVLLARVLLVECR